MTRSNNVTRRNENRQPRPFSLAQGKEAFAAILTRINSTKNDIVNADVSRPQQGAVSSAIKLDSREAKKLIDELALVPRGLAKVILDRVLPQRLEAQQKDGIFLTKNAAKELNATAEAYGVSARYEAKKPVLPLAQPIMPPVQPPNSSPIEGIVPLGRIGESAPADPKIVSRINEISSQVIAHEAGKGKNVLASVVNILDMIAPVAVSLLPAAGDDPATKALKSTSMKKMKADLDGTHLSDQEFIHQLQVVHAQLLQFKGMITMGNEIVLNEGEALRGNVLKAVESGFDVKVKTLPMKRDPEAAATAMNDSIEKATAVYETPAGGGEPQKVKDGLKDVVKSDFVSTLDAASIATLTALLDWRYVFDKANTEEKDVTSADGSQVKRKLMEMDTGHRVNPESNEREEVPKLDCAEANGFVFVKLPYDDKIDHGSESRWGPPPTRIYRIVGAPHVDGANRHTKLAGVVGDLGANDPLKLEYEDRKGKVVMAKVQAEGEADPFDLLATAGVDAKAWAFPLLEGPAVQFTKGIHKGAVEDTEKGSIVQFVSVGGLERTSLPPPERPFELRTDVPYYNAIVVELKGPRGELLPLKIAEWTVESFKDTKDPQSNRG